MKYLALHPDYDLPIVFTDERSAKMGCFELGLSFYYPVETESSPYDKVVTLKNGAWITESLSDLKCSCGCNL